ncbi:hypothetical protein F5Y13DRAFT_204306 [Hypoxylon sp. FL1857]|nr:hypothetical protein F5Y13DRAFT_204306 [Hypoxylon sp. FL1857]
MIAFDVEARSKLLDKELTSKFCGYAKIALDQLFFGWDEDPDEKKIDHLQRIFKQVGCDRRNPSHFLSGSIPTGVLQASLQQSNLNQHDLQNPEPPELRLPAGQQVHCLGGRHRVLALRKHNPSATWWSVKLYIDLSPEACRLLTEEFANEAKYLDGEIVAHILRHPEHSIDANQWWARLDKSKPRTLKKILSHPTLGPAFKRVVEIPGLRPGLLLAPWHKILPCVEEVVHCLQLIHQTWVHIVGSEAALRFVDKDAVMELESRAPGVSYCDERHIEQKIRSEAIFKAVKDGNQRDFILQNLKQVTFLIPSIHTLQQDFKYLRQCTHVLRKLINKTGRNPLTVQTMARHSFHANEEQSVTHEAKFLPNLKLLYLYIMQDVCRLSGQPPLKDIDDEENYELLPYDAIAWHRLALRASELGFCSDEIIRLCRIDPDREVAIKALYEARPREKFDYGPQFELIIDNLVNALQAVQPVEPQRSPAELTSHVGEPIPRRRGRVYSNTYDRDRHFITLDNIICEVRKDTDITSLFVRRSVFLAFWGWSDDDQNGLEGNQESHDIDDIMSDSEQEGAGRGPNESGEPPALSYEQNMEGIATISTNQSPQNMEGIATISTNQSPQNMEGIATVSPNRSPRNTVATRQSHVRLGRRRRPVLLPKRTETSIQKGVRIRLEKQRAKEITSALTKFLPGSSTSAPQYVELSRKMSVLVLQDHNWKEAAECKREEITTVVRRIWAELGSNFYLYNKDGRGIAVEDCPGCSEDFVCLSTNSNEGFPAQEIY